MPRFAVALLSLTGLLAAPLAAQRRELTVVAGGTLSWATGDNLAEVHKQAGFIGGLSLRLPRAAQFSLETSLLAVQRRLSGQRPPSTAPPEQSGPLSESVNLLFAEAQVLLRFQRGFSTVRPIRPYIHLGPYLGVRLGCRREVTESNGNTRRTDCTVIPGSTGSESFIPAVYQEVDLGLLAGAGVEVRRFAFGLRFERSLRNLVESGGLVRTSPFDSSRLWSVMGSVEYLIRVI